jgi:hypothetical protein
MTITIPTFSKDRGTFKFDPVTKSQLNDAVFDTTNNSFLTDAGECGCDEYNSVAKSVTIQTKDSCVIKPVANASLQVRLLSDEYTADEFDKVMIYLVDEAIREAFGAVALGAVKAARCA